jgi:hypothetical protein
VAADKRHQDRDRPTASKYNVFVEPEGESPSPPPPPIISSDNKQRDESSPAKGSVFKDVKLPKGRNYMRRNVAAKSHGLDIAPVAATGDVDLRLGGPPEKRPHLDMFEPDSTALVPSAEEDAKSKRTEFQFHAWLSGLCVLVGVVSLGNLHSSVAIVHLFPVAFLILSHPSFL